ncbi:MAG: VCBS repeat-containing protein, partial [Candidatus Eremiobacterota bacterium]
MVLLLLVLGLACGGSDSVGPNAQGFDALPFSGPPEVAAGIGPPDGEAGPGPQGVGRDLSPTGLGGGGPTSGRAHFLDRPLFRGSPPPPNYLLLGLNSRGGGWTEAFNLPVAGAPEHAAWGRIPWDNYNSVDGSVRPAAGDIDGDGRDELVYGLGPASAGWVYVVDDPGTGLAPIGWLQVSWPGYTGSGNAPTYPACADLDGDGKDEVVLGLGSGGGGWAQVFSYSGGTTFVPFAGAPVANGWVRVSWPTYADWPNAPVYPAGGNLDGAGGAELVLGLGSRGGGWSQVWTFNGSTLVPYGGTPLGGGWVLLDWAGYNASGNAPIYPACGDLDRDGKDDLVLGLGTVGAGWLQVLRSTGSTLSPMPPLAGGWARVPWTGYASSGDAASYPACGDLDGDTRDDLVVGLGSAGYGWAYVWSGGSLSPPAWGGWVQVN